MKCNYCGEIVEGNCFVCNGNVYHKECHKEYINKDKFKCPKCNGKGTINEKYDDMPYFASGGGMITDYKYRKVRCKVCDGKGYTDKKKKPIYKIEGWE